ncbi:MAG: hypothetical protein D6729_03845 [Deltaproteobacteria bacterium]|nr:MAG: hypothetical protein D6729_03845 [Deltaproteobacteria bacterium]
MRDAHRRSLTAHFVLMVSGLALLALANRMLSPATLWVHWAALAWGLLFVGHLVLFERGTMATMGRRRNGRRP